MDLKEKLHEITDIVIAAKNKTDFDCVITLRSNSLEFDVFKHDDECDDECSELITSAKVMVLNDDIYYWFSRINGKYNEATMTESEWLEMLSRYIPVDVRRTA